MSRTFEHFRMIVACAVCLAKTVSAQKVTTTGDDKYSFSDHKHYAWRENRLMTRQNPDTNEVMDLKIVKAVNQLLAAKGFVEVKEKPDFSELLRWWRKRAAWRGRCEPGRFRPHDFRGHYSNVRTWQRTDAFCLNLDESEWPDRVSYCERNGPQAGLGNHLQQELP